MIELKDVEAARERIKGLVHRTSLRHSTTFSKLTGAQVWLKFENAQRTGSFKIRGALNKILTMPEADRKKGVVAASAGNHAQGVALAAQLNGVRSTIVMPLNAAIAKVEATRSYGAEVILHGANYNEAFDHCEKILKERKATLMHAFDDDAIMAGQGTIGLEVLEDLPDLDVMVVPIGGGGLISGIATAIKGKRPQVRMVGVEAEGAASLPESLKRGKVVPIAKVETIADGLATKQVGVKTFEVIRKRVDEVVIVSDQEIARAILLLLERSKNVVEGAGAAALAALLSGKLKVKGKKVAVLISGGNIDINFLDQIIRRGLREEGRLLTFRTVLADKPGTLRSLLDVLANAQGNIREVRHERSKAKAGFGRAEVEIEVETRGATHRDEIIVTLRKAGYDLLE